MSRGKKMFLLQLGKFPHATSFKYRQGASQSFKTFPQVHNPHSFLGGVEKCTAVPLNPEWSCWNFLFFFFFKGKNMLNTLYGNKGVALRTEQLVHMIWMLWVLDHRQITRGNEPQTHIVKEFMTFMEDQNIHSHCAHRSKVKPSLSHQDEFCQCLNKNCA